ncbi:MAG: hypothetical protein Q8Q01_01330 [archaeon]|nr:hypothetical protein [archaeon]
MVYYKNILGLYLAIITLSSCATPITKDQDLSKDVVEEGRVLTGFVLKPDQEGLILKLEQFKHYPVSEKKTSVNVEKYSNVDFGLRILRRGSITATLEAGFGLYDDGLGIGPIAGAGTTLRNGDLAPNYLMGMNVLLEPFRLQVGADMEKSRPYVNLMWDF